MRFIFRTSLLIPGLENEGFYDPWQLLSALREKNITLGVVYVQGEVEGFRFHKDVRYSESVGIETDVKSRRISGAFVKPKMIGASARPIETYQIINCGGPWAGQICEMAGIGNPVIIRPLKQILLISRKGYGNLKCSYTHQASKAFLFRCSCTGCSSCSYASPT